MKVHTFHLQERQILYAVMQARVAVSTQLFHFDPELSRVSALQTIDFLMEQPSLF
jgi:hypothetical protein